MSNKDEALRLGIKGAISELPKETQDKVSECYGKLQDYLREYGEEGKIALALLGATLAAEED